jgi:nucleotide-binding universal stress UspA family protein
MFRRYVIPVDLTELSWRSVDVARRLAEISDGSIDIVHVTPARQDHDAARRRLDDEVARRFGPDHAVSTTVVVASVATDQATAAAIGDHLGGSADTLLVIGSHGRGRSEVMLGSVAGALLRLRPEPIVIVGPKAQRPRPGAPAVLAIDGPDAAASTISVGAAWMQTFDVGAWVVEVSRSADSAEWSEVDATIERLTRLTGRPARANVIDDSDVARGLRDFAVTVDAGVIVMATHARAGIDRLLHGSVTADIVRTSLSPVLVVRAPWSADVAPSLRLAMP